MHPVCQVFNFPQQGVFVKQKMQDFLAFSLGLLFLVTMGCSALGVPTPKNPQEQIVVTMAAVTSVRNTATTLLHQKKISAEDAENVQKQADNVRAGTVIAQYMLAVDPASADAKLRQTWAALIALQAYLETKEKK
jgi:hypothetical protein